MKIETEDLSNGVKISITNSNGITTETTIYDGEKGEQGERGPERRRRQDLRGVLPQLKERMRL